MRVTKSSWDIFYMSRLYNFLERQLCALTTLGIVRWTSDLMKVTSSSDLDSVGVLKRFFLEDKLVSLDGKNHTLGLFISQGHHIMTVQIAQFFESKKPQTHLDTNILLLRVSRDKCVALTKASSSLALKKANIS